MYTCTQKEDMFSEKTDPITYSRLETIGGRDIITKGIGAAIWYCTDDEVKLNKKKFNNLIYFP